MIPLFFHLEVSGQQQNRRNQRDKKAPRFEIGTAVECVMDDDGGRARGTVVDHFYREPGWPPAHWAPYQVQLDNGGLIFVPTDQDQCVRLARGAR